MTGPVEQIFASRTLQNLGSGCGKAVLEYLKNDDWTVRAEVCRILKVIGTKERRAPLEREAQDANPWGRLGRSGRGGNDSSKELSRAEALQSIGYREGKGTL